ncbi:MAG: hypothetical protein ACRDZM_01575 [Acidimicrobiia bacterium]
MPETYSGRFRRLAWTVIGATALVAAVPIAVFAAHSFNDVPDSNEFHGSITWMKDNGVTVGCNPPANTEFCPDDNVPREQMASFMRRFAQTFGSAGVNVTDPADTVDSTGVTFVELATIDAEPKAEADVVLNAHATLTKDSTVEGTYELIIARDSCTGTVLGSASWQGLLIAGATTETNTVSLTASDVATTTTTYVLCIAEADDANPAATAGTRGLNAAWVPTA